MRSKPSHHSGTAALDGSPQSEPSQDARGSTGQSAISTTGKLSISSTQASILVAVIALVGGAIGAAVTGYAGLVTAREKNAEEIQLARLQFESQLILKAVDAKSRDEAIRNLKFFLDAGFLTVTGGKIAGLSTSQYPSLGGLRDPESCKIFAHEGFRTGAVTPATDDDYSRVPQTLAVDAPSLKALASVEGNTGFLPSGRPRILFERHTFAHLTGGKYSSDYPDISNETPGGYGAAGEHQYDRLTIAANLDCEAALEATSWGMFGLMGSLYKSAGYQHVDDFVLDEMQSGSKQLESMATWLQNTGALAALKGHDWKAVALKLNGPNFALHNYDQLLQEAYDKFNKH